MAEKRKLELDADLVVRFTKQLEGDLQVARKEYKEAAFRYEHAKDKVETILRQLKQLSGETYTEYQTGHYLEAQVSSGVYRPEEKELPVWEKLGFQWRRYLPMTVEALNEFVTMADILNAIGMSESDKQKHYATVSSALSVLAKEKEKLVAIGTPNVRGQLYGLPSFLNEEGVVKFAYVEKARKRNYL